jgi:hypothetical protein
MGAARTNTPPVSVPLVPLKTCSGETVAAADGLVDDLEDGNGQVAMVAGRSGYWYSAADPKGSTISGAGAFAPSDGGASGSKKAARATGKTATGEGAWGATFRQPSVRCLEIRRYLVLGESVRQVDQERPLQGG